MQDPGRHLAADPRQRAPRRRRPVRLERRPGRPAHRLPAAGCRAVRRHAVQLRHQSADPRLALVHVADLRPRARERAGRDPGLPHPDHRGSPARARRARRRARPYPRPDGPLARPAADPRSDQREPPPDAARRSGRRPGAARPCDRPQLSRRPGRQRPARRALGAGVHRHHRADAPAARAGRGRRRACFARARGRQRGGLAPAVARRGAALDPRDAAGRGGDSQRRRRPGHGHAAATSSGAGRR